MMNIRKKLLIFIPALLVLSNGVSFFVFQSGRTVQQSYNVMLERVLMYRQIATQTDSNLRALNIYLLDQSDRSREEYLREAHSLKLMRDQLTEQKTNAPSAGADVRNYRNLLNTYIEEEAGVLKAWGEPSSLRYVPLYEELEATAGFIREEGHQLIDAELRYYQPFYRQIFTHTEAMNLWGIGLFIINTLLSIMLAYWLSLGITEPIKKLVHAARAISRGNLQTKPPQVEGSSEIRMLSEAFGRMQDDLLQLIEKDKANLEKDRLVKELELKALQNQMNPHFLFNSLNVLAKLALLEGAERTSDLTVSMSNLLRYNLRKLDQPVPLRDEVEQAKEYFTIQQARFRDRIQFVTHIDEAALDVLVPVLTLQPILENVFVHGIEGMEAGAVVTLSIERVPSEVRISIADNGSGMTEETRSALLRMGAEPADSRSGGQSTGLGTYNVFRRLELYYGRTDLVDIQSEPGEGTTVLIRIPDKEEHKGQQDIGRIMTPR
ncbi:histidine kinase [Paenibacillus sp. chi10]|uniref:histidine kinase n=1 Tax=Paenibacillus suaedae TaxID=3077233 RepID=A0AAJ2JWV3_9BACL|nr:histidine kinase [Paenibacillus sp. chi10]MDT8978580.1 histidine kinase [Paenibacillus sp. chi10]